MSFRVFLFRTTFWTILCVVSPMMVFAGPPFKTDDPQPVDFQHWEFYIASQQQFLRHESNLTCPHIEINYGALPDLQLHIVAPLGYVHSIDGTHYGYSDTELGIKYRFKEETENSPQIGCFPLVEIPTGNSSLQLGNGTAQMYLPIWIQKSWSKFTMYGGSGLWYNPSVDHKNSIFAGLEAQYDLSEVVTVGGEIYSQTAQTEDSEGSRGYNIGGFINISEEHHILFSLGHTFSGDNSITGYIAYQLTI
jgi:hypothetical protein